MKEFALDYYKDEFAEKPFLTEYFDKEEQAEKRIAEMTKEAREKTTGITRTMDLKERGKYLDMMGYGYSIRKIKKMKA